MDPVIRTVPELISLIAAHHAAAKALVRPGDMCGCHAPRMRRAHACRKRSRCRRTARTTTARAETGCVESWEFGQAVRRWRDRAAPETVGMPVGGRRRAAGLRREELAGLAGISVDYLTRLEQGRATSPWARDGSPDQPLTGIVGGPATHDGERGEQFGQVARVGGQRVERVGNQVGELAWSDAAQPVLFVVEGVGAVLKHARCRRILGLLRHWPDCRASAVPRPRLRRREEPMDLGLDHPEMGRCTCR